MNAHHQSINFVLPKHEAHEYWHPVFDTRSTHVKRRWLTQGYRYQLVARSLAVLQLKQVRPKTLARVAKWFHHEVQPPLPPEKAAPIAPVSESAASTVTKPKPNAPKPAEGDPKP